MGGLLCKKWLKVTDWKLQGQSFQLLVPDCCRRRELISREFPGSYQVCASPKQRGTFNRSRSAVRHCMYLVKSSDSHVHWGNIINWWLLVTCNIRYCELPTALSTCAEIWKIHSWLCWKSRSMYFMERWFAHPTPAYISEETWCN